MKNLFLLLVFSLLVTALYAQSVAIKNKADKLMAAEPAKALELYKQFLLSVTSNSSSADVFAVYDSASIAALLTKDYPAAEKLLAHAFEYARKHGGTPDVNKSLIQLSDFYKNAQKNNWPLDHPIKKGLLREMIFTISKVKYISKDSSILTVAAGSDDGLSPGTDVQGVGVKLPFLSDDRSTNILGKGMVTKVTPNYSEVVFRQTYSADSSDNIYTGDIIICRAAPVYKSDLGDYQVLADNNIWFLDNYKQQPYNLRQLASYDIKSEAALLDTFYIEAVKEIADIIKDDTTEGSTLAKKIPAGTYKGLWMAAAMERTDVPHIKAFLKFVKEFPGKYSGQHFKFPEVYATWLINSSPMGDQGLLELLTEYKGTAFYNECINVYDSSIINERFWLTWKDNFLDSLDNNVFPEKTWEVLQSTANHFHQPWMLAWNRLLMGRVAAYNKNVAVAARFIAEAKDDFDKLTMKDEALFAENTLIQVNNQRVAKIAIQINHTLPFSVSYSTDGKYFATYGDDYTIKLWDAKLVRQIESINAHVNTINQVTFTANNKYFISASDDGYIRVWDTRSQHLFKEIHTEYRVKYAALNKTGDKIIAAGSDSSVHTYDFASGKQINRFVIHKAAINSADYNTDYQQLFYTAGSDSMSYIVNLETGSWSRWFRNGGKISQVKVTEDRQIIAALSNDRKIKLWRINGNFLGSFSTTDYRWGKNPILPGFDVNSRKKIMAFVDGDGKLNLADLDSMRYYTYNITFEGQILDIKFHPNGNSLLLTTLLGKLYFINLTQYNIEHGAEIESKLVGSNAAIISSLSFSDNDKDLAFQSGSTYIMDLTTGKNIDLGEEGSSQLRSNIYFTHHDSALVYVPYDAQRLQEKNFYTNDTLSQVITKPDGVAFNAMSQDGKLSAIWFNRKSVDIYDNATKKLLYQVPLDSNQTQLITALFIPGTNRIAVFNDVNNSVGFYEMNAPVLKPFYRFTSTDEYEFGSGCYDPVHNLVVAPCQNNTVYFLDAQSGKMKDSVNFDFIDKEQGVTTVRLHPDGNSLFVGLNSLMLIYDLLARKVKYNFNNETNTSASAQFSHDGRLLAVGSFNGEISLFDTKDYKKLIQVQTFSNKEPVWVTPDNYYIASRSSLQDLYFSYNHTLYPFDQFDINFNRPDTVLQRIGKIDRSLLTAYKEAWNKRFKKSGIPAERLRPDFKVPEITIVNAEEIPVFVTASQVIPFQLHMKDDNARIISYNFWVNGVPVYGKDGKKLLKPVSQVSLTDSVMLSGINNVVQVSCKNEDGMESLKEKFEIKNYVKDTGNYKTYLFCVSVSDYKDPKYRLKYARKDGRDLVNAFKKEFGNNIFIDTLFDDKATLKNILAWKKIMEGTRIKDRVILYVSGHGLLDKNYDFYYATYDVDFKNPAGKGLAYDEIEKLLDKIPARKKLLLMDACHSGEVDKDAAKIKTVDNTAMNDKKVNVVYRSKGVDEDASTANLGLQNSFELMQELFTNLNNGNGTFVISAAAGNSYAYESDVWNNGIFTYCLLHGLKDKAADYNKDGRVAVSELQKFVSSEVQQLTKGAQKPTARQENLDNDWLVW